MTEAVNEVSSSDADSVSDQPESLAIAEDEPELLTGPETPEPPTTIEVEQVDEDSDAEDVESLDNTATACSAPALQGHFVDVALDDPDGGLNLRDGAGPIHGVLATFERGSEVIPTGECTIVGATDWWQVTNTDGSLIGWVSNHFLSDTVLLSPGLGRLEVDHDNAGLQAETIEGLAEQLAIIYGFGEDATITEVNVEGNDASSGNAIYDITGLQDDSVDGYRVDILFFIERDATGEELFGFSATRIDRRALCSRGVTDDGLCV